MNNIIFLDIDGVLNDMDYFRKSKDVRHNYYKCLTGYKKLLLTHLLDIDLNKVYLLKELINNTNSKVVVTSSWRNLRIYPLVEDYLINLGIPIIDTTPYIDSKRGLEIKTYLEEHEVSNYIILDDDIFPDFDEEILIHLIHTSFFYGGLTDEHVYEGIYRLRR